MREQKSNKKTKPNSNLSGICSISVLLCWALRTGLSLVATAAAIPHTLRQHLHASHVPPCKTISITAMPTSTGHYRATTTNRTHLTHTHTETHTRAYTEGGLEPGKNCILNRHTKNQQAKQLFKMAQTTSQLVGHTQGQRW